jgi:hypothetical protein
MKVNNMSDEIKQDELTLLKARAKQMGIKHHPKIGLAKLKAKVAAGINDKPQPDDQEEGAAPSKVGIKPKGNALPVESKMQMNQRLRKEAGVQIRVQITCMNTNKKEWGGEVFTVSNSVVGTFKKYVPFNNPEGWHVPKIILNMIQERQCQIFSTVKDARGNKIRKGKLINEFSIDVMDSLTKEQLDDLAIRQAQGKHID